MSSCLINPGSVYYSQSSLIYDGHVEIYGEILQERRKYLAYKLLLEIALETAKDGDISLPSLLRQKVKRMLLFYPLKRNGSCWRRTGCEMKKNSFGLAALTSSEMKYDEGDVLRQAVESRLHKKVESVSNEFEKLTGENVHSSNRAPLHQQSQVNRVLELKKRLNKEQRGYALNLKTCLATLEKMLELRVRRVPEIIAHKMKQFEIEAQIYELQSKICEANTRVQIMTESEVSLEAYAEAIKDLKEQESECETEVNDLIRLKEGYRAVQCEQFSCILQAYLQYKSSFEKKKCMYEQFKSKTVGNN